MAESDIRMTRISLITLRILGDGQELVDESD